MGRHHSSMRGFYWYILFSLFANRAEERDEGGESSGAEENATSEEEVDDGAGGENTFVVPPELNAQLPDCATAPHAWWPVGICGGHTIVYSDFTAKYPFRHHKKGD